LSEQSKYDHGIRVKKFEEELITASFAHPAGQQITAQATKNGYLAMSTWLSPNYDQKTERPIFYSATINLIGPNAKIKNGQKATEKALELDGVKNWVSGNPGALSHPDFSSACPDNSREWLVTLTSKTGSLDVKVDAYTGNSYLPNPCPRLGTPMKVLQKSPKSISFRDIVTGFSYECPLANAEDDSKKCVGYLIEEKLYSVLFNSVGIAKTCDAAGITVGVWGLSKYQTNDQPPEEGIKPYSCNFHDCKRT
jgi:hypothetical protein